MKIYYDEGWNAYWADEPYDPKATLDWRDGWLDAQGADAEGYINEE